MKPSVSFLPAALALAGLAACGGGGPAVRSAPPPPSSPDSPAARALRDVIPPLYAQEVLHGGMVIGLIETPASGAPSVTWLGFGRRSAAEPAAPGPDAVFEIGSVSKVLTALLLADAVVRGEVALDTPVAQLLPFGVRFPDVGGARPTLAHLASHRAGLDRLPDNLAPANLADPYAGYGARELYAYLERATLLAPPGEAYAYSNLGAGILGHVLADKLGRTYEAAVTERVLAPLGLDETWIAVPAEAAARALPGFTAGGQPAAAWTFDALAGAGAWRSTPRDMATLVEAGLAATTGGAGPLADALRLSVRPQGDAGPDMEIGLGWHLTAEGVVWHNGMTGGFASFIGFHPAERRGVVVLASSASPLVTRIGIGAFDVLAGKPLDLDLRLVTLADAQLDALAGAYRLGDGTALAVERRGAALYVVMGAEAVRLYPRSPTEFILLELESTVDFVIEDGVVRGFVLHLPTGDVIAERAVAP